MLTKYQKSIIYCQCVTACASSELNFDDVSKLISLSSLSEFDYRLEGQVRSFKKDKS